jgi:hypothetical protein
MFFVKKLGFAFWKWTNTWTRVVWNSLSTVHLMQMSTEKIDSLLTQCWLFKVFCWTRHLFTWVRLLHQSSIFSIEFLLGLQHRQMTAEPTSAALRLMTDLRQITNEPLDVMFCVFCCLQFFLLVSVFFLTSNSETFFLCFLNEWYENLVLLFTKILWTIFLFCSLHLLFPVFDL